MSNALTDDVYSQLEGAPLRQMAQQLGIGPAQMAGAVSAALPLLLGALGRNASQPQGAEALFGALQKDHAGMDIGNVLGAVLGGGAGQGDGGKILGHVFGGRQPRAEQALGQATGLGGDRAGMLLKMLAPIVLAYLAKRMFEQRQATNAATPQVLGEVLGQEEQRVSQQGGLGSGVLGAVLDQDGDGQLGLSDLLKIGGGLLGGRR
jgi:hypothetical protein